MDEKKICCICGKEFTGWGNNPDPITDADGNLFDENDCCCDDCNNNVVIPARLIEFYSNDNSNN